MLCNLHSLQNICTHVNDKQWEYEKYTRIEPLIMLYKIHINSCFDNLLWWVLIYVKQAQEMNLALDYGITYLKFILNVLRCSDYVSFIKIIYLLNYYSPIFISPYILDKRYPRLLFPIIGSIYKLPKLVTTSLLRIQ